MKTKLLLLQLLITITVFAQNTYVPDDNFEQALIDLGYDNVLDDYVLTANINTVTDLDIHHLDIFDLTGLEDFTALTDLDCHSNPIGTAIITNTSLINLDLFQTVLSYLDITELTNLEYLNVGMNHLTELNTTHNTALKTLYCYYNDDDYLFFSFSNNLALTELVFFGNLIIGSEFDVTNNPNLTFIDCSDNNIGGVIDFSNNPDLAILNCVGNNLTELDLSSNTNLTSLFCAYNQLNTINLRNNNNSTITYFKAYGNDNLSCIFVDDKNYSNENWIGSSFEFDPHTHFVETQTECDAVSSIDDIQQQKRITVFPNPIQDFFKINTTIQYESIYLYDTVGKLITQFDKQNKYTIKEFPTGVYYIKLSTPQTILIKKIIKQ